MANNNETKVITGKVRFSYANVFEPRKNDDGTEKYSVSLLIDNDDTKTINSIKKAIESAKKAHCTVIGVYDEYYKNDWNKIQSIADGIIYDF